MAQSKKSNLSASSLEDEDDAAVGAAFLGINRNIVKTAREPKPPKDYVDSSVNVLDSADKQKKEQNAPKKEAIRKGPQVALGGKKDDQKQSQSDDKNKKKADDKK